MNDVDDRMVRVELSLDVWRVGRGRRVALAIQEKIFRGRVS